VKRYVLHPEANQEYAEALAYYAAIDRELGERFFSEIEALLSDISRNPARYRLVEPRVRRHISQLFPYGILYTRTTRSRLCDGRDGYAARSAVLATSTRLSRWILPRIAVFAGKKLVRMSVADNLFFGAVPFDAAAEAPGKHSQKRKHGGTVRDFDSGGGRVFLFDRFQKIGPEQF
jgi:hypothetical protein